MNNKTATLADYTKYRFLMEAFPYSEQFYSGNLETLLSEIKYSYITKSKISEDSLTKLNEIYTRIKRDYVMNDRRLIYKPAPGILRRLM